MNLITKTYALLVSKEISIWHYSCKPEGNKFYYVMTGDTKDEHSFATMEELINAAYSRIDPLEKELLEPMEPKS